MRQQGRQPAKTHKVGRNRVVPERYIYICIHMCAPVLTALLETWCTIHIPLFTTLHSCLHLSPFTLSSAPLAWAYPCYICTDSSFTCTRSPCQLGQTHRISARPELLPSDGSSIPALTAPDLCILLVMTTDQSHAHRSWTFAAAWSHRATSEGPYGRGCHCGIGTCNGFIMCKRERFTALISLCPRRFNALAAAQCCRLTTKPPSVHHEPSSLTTNCHNRCRLTKPR